MGYSSGINIVSKAVKLILIKKIKINPLIKLKRLFGVFAYKILNLLYIILYVDLILLFMFAKKD